MKIAVIGHTGRVGTELLKQEGYVPLDCDIRNEKSVEKAITSCKPDVVVSLASKSSPEWCEDDKNFKEMFDVNVRGVLNLGEVTRKLGVPSVILSTDHVFSGKSYLDFSLKRWIKKGPYKEDYYRRVPVNQYGRTKLSGEYMAGEYENMKIIRTSYLFNSRRLQGIRYSAEVDYRNQSYPTFIRRSFMHINHFIESILYYINNIDEMPKILHISGSETVNWATFMKTWLPEAKINTHNKDDKAFTPRPHRAGLDVSLSAKLGLPQYSYKDGLDLL
jgi:dTDP-4-dehydrorhamnose reductase